MQLSDEHRETGITAGVLADIASEFSDLTNWEQRVENALRMLCTAVHSGTAALAVRMADWKTFYCPGESYADILNKTLRDHYCVLSTGQPDFQYCMDEEDEPPKADRSRYKLGSTASLPVIGAGRVLGVLHVSTEKENAYTIDDVSVLSIVATLLGSFLVNVRSLAREVEERELIVQAEREAHQARFAAERRTAELETLMSSMGEGIVFFNKEGVVTYVNDAGRAILGLPPGVSPDSLLANTQRYNIETGEPIPRTQSAPYRAMQGETVRSQRYRMALPNGREFAIEITSTPIPDPAGGYAGAVSVFRDVTALVQIEKQKEELLNREHNIAQTLQRALVPPEADFTLDGCRIATRYLPGSREAEIGGDFYDVFALPDSRIGILIGDVVGKGLRAAVAVASTRYSIRSYAYQNPSPGAVLSMVNDLVFSTAEEDVPSLFTAFFGVVDTKKGTLVFANGGHEAPVVSGEGGAQLLELGGLMLGIQQGITYSEARYKLQKDEKLVLVTDGISEARTDSNLFGMKRVQRYVERNHHLPPEEIASGLLQAAIEHGGGNLKDDAAIVVLEMA